MHARAHNSPAYRAGVTPDASMVAAAPCLSLIGKAHRSWDDGNHGACATFAKAAQELAWDMLHVGNWRSVPAVWRKLYAVAARARAAAMLTATPGTDSATGAGPSDWERSDAVVQAAVYALDMALMFGGPRESAITHELIAAIDEAHGPAPSAAARGVELDAAGGGGGAARAGATRAGAGEDAGAGAGAGAVGSHSGTSPAVGGIVIQQHAKANACGAGGGGAASARGQPAANTAALGGQCTSRSAQPAANPRPPKVCPAPDVVRCSRVP